jgi:hypothetical protein
MANNAATRWIPSVPLCSASQATSFAYESTVKRWPAILTGIVSELAAVNHLSRDEEAVAQGQAIIAELGGLIYEMRHDRELSPLVDTTQIPGDVELYNAELRRMKELGQHTWFSASWLYAECYMFVFSFSPLSLI